MTRKNQKKIDSPIDKISEAIKKINEGYSELSSLDPIKSYKENKLWKRIAVVSSILSGIFIYQQYVANNIKSRIDSLDQTFLFSLNSLESKSTVVQATGVNNLYSVAFNPTIVEDNNSAFSPFTNLWNTIMKNQEYRYLERARKSFIIFAQTPREEITSSIDPVSSEIIKTAVNWQQSELLLFKKSKNNSDDWLLYRGKVKKANCPNIDLTDQLLFETDLSLSNFNAANFKDSYLENSIFTKSDLSSSNFESTTLHNAKLNDCKLNYSNFNKTQALKVDFTDSIMEQASFENSNLRGSRFDNAIIQGVNFTGADLTDCSFINCNFNNVDLANTITTNVDFTKSKMEGVLNFKNNKK